LLKNYDLTTPEDFITSTSEPPATATPKADEGEEPNPPQPFDFDPA